MIISTDLLWLGYANIRLFRHWHHDLTKQETWMRMCNNLDHMLEQEFPELDPMDISFTAGHIMQILAFNHLAAEHFVKEMELK